MDGIVKIGNRTIRMTLQRCHPSTQRERERENRLNAMKLFHSYKKNLIIIKSNVDNNFQF